jgi:hypothetical protein
MSATRNDGDKACTVRRIPLRNPQPHDGLTPLYMYRPADQRVVRHAHEMVPAPPWCRLAPACRAPMAQTQKRRQEGSHSGAWGGGREAQGPVAGQFFCFIMLVCIGWSELRSDDIIVA